MDRGVRVFDEFVPDAATLRAAGLAADFIDYPGHDGEIYKRVRPGEIPGVRQAIEQAMGRPVDMLGMAYRLNFNGEKPNASIHSDMGWGTHALVLFLSEGEGGTAFWRHKKTGAARIDPGDFELFELVRNDWDNEAAWDLEQLVPMKLGRALIYESALFHSRFPFEAFGTGPDDGRLIVVAFFS